MKAFQATVSALCYSVINERCPAAGSDLEFPHNRIVCFVLEQHRRMPDFLRLPFLCATLVFEVSAAVRHGRLFHQLPSHQRRRHMNAWRNAPVGVCRDLVRFYESFVIYAIYCDRASRSSGRLETSGNGSRSAA